MQLKTAIWDSMLTNLPNFQAYTLTHYKSQYFAQLAFDVV